MMNVINHQTNKVKSSIHWAHY